MDNNFGQQPQPPLDQNQTPPNPVPTQPPVVPSPMPPVQPPIAPQPPMMPPVPQKKSLLWLWITLAVVVVVIIGLVIGFFIAKSNADKTAASYTTSAKSYLGDVYDAASGSASDPADIEKDIEAVDKPELKKVFLSSASGDYADAENLSKDIDAKVSELQGKVKSYASYYEFYTKNKDLNQDISDIAARGLTASNASSTLKEVGGKLDDINKLIRDTTFPDELTDKKAALETATKQCITAWHAMEAAFDDRDQAGYISSFDDYKACLSPLTTAARPFDEFYNSLGSKIKDASKDVQDLQDSVDTTEA